MERKPRYDVGYKIGDWTVIDNHVLISYKSIVSYGYKLRCKCGKIIKFNTNIESIATRKYKMCSNCTSKAQRAENIGFKLDFLEVIKPIESTNMYEFKCHICGEHFNAMLNKVKLWKVGVCKKCKSKIGLSEICNMSLDFAKNGKVPMYTVKTSKKVKNPNKVKKKNIVEIKASEIKASEVNMDGAIMLLARLYQLAKSDYKYTKYRYTVVKWIKSPDFGALYPGINSEFILKYLAKKYPDEKEHCYD